MKSPQRLLPESWQGDSREARWRRSRGRRVLTGLLTGCAMLAVVGAVRPADPPTHTVTVATHDLPAGQRLTSADLRQVSWSTADRIPGLLSSSYAAGKILTAPIRAGEPVTGARVRGARSWPSVPPDKVIVGLTAGERVLVQVLQPGDRVDLIDTAKGRTVATAVRVVSVPGADEGEAAGPTTRSASADAPAVLVAVSPTQAAAVGSASAATAGGVGGGIQLALRAGA